MPTEAPANGSASRSALLVMTLGRLGKNAATPAGVKVLVRNSGEKATAQAGSQYPQNPVPVLCSSSAPKRMRCEPFCQVRPSWKVKRRRSRPWVAFDVSPTWKLLDPCRVSCGKPSPRQLAPQSEEVGNRLRLCQ